MSKWHFLAPFSNLLVQSLFTIFIAILTTFLIESWYWELTPELIQIKSVTIFKDENNARWIEVHFDNLPTNNCIRLSQHQLYRNIDVGGPEREYLPLGGAMNGSQFHNAVKDYLVKLSIPNLSYDNWLYINRTSYICTIWPGLVKLTTTETPPVKVEFK